MVGEGAGGKPVVGFGDGWVSAGLRLSQVWPWSMFQGETIGHPYRMS